MKQKYYITIITILLFISAGFYLQMQNYKYSSQYEDATPHLELTPGMNFYDEFGVGKITGFVTFPNIEDQPRGAWQYYTIEATDKFDQNGIQIYVLTETIKMPLVAPRSFDEVILTQTSNTPQSLSLEGPNGESFRIDKNTKQVSVIDGQGDIATLITDESEYREFMLKFLRRKLY